MSERKQRRPSTCPAHARPNSEHARNTSAKQALPGSLETLRVKRRKYVQMQLWALLLTLVVMDLSSFYEEQKVM